MIGAVSAAVIVAGAVTYEAAMFLQTDTKPAKPVASLASNAAPVERSAYELPGFSTGRATEWTPSFPLIPLIDSDGNPTSDNSDSAKRPPTAAPSKKPPAAKTTAKPEAPSAAPANTATAPATTATPAEAKTTVKPAAPEAAPAPVVQWRVVVTAQASYFNLGGHVDSAGIVDSLASSHLRDALKAHRNFSQLPADIRTHILTQNINLNKLAPYRALVGMNDKQLEEEQAVRFVKVASR